MTYFDPQIYCKQNLKENHRKEFERWKEVIDLIIDRAESECDYEDNTLGKIQEEIVEGFCERLRETANEVMQENLIGCIESYEGDVEPVKEPETF